MWLHRRLLKVYLLQVSGLFLPNAVQTSRPLLKSIGGADPHSPHLILVSPDCKWTSLVDNVQMCLHICLVKLEKVCLPHKASLVCESEELQFMHLDFTGKWNLKARNLLSCSVCTGERNQGTWKPSCVCADCNKLEFNCILMWHHNTSTLLTFIVVRCLVCWITCIFKASSLFKDVLGIQNQRRRGKNYSVFWIPFINMDMCPASLIINNYWPRLFRTSFHCFVATGLLWGL